MVKYSDTITQDSLKARVAMVKAKFTEYAVERLIPFPAHLIWEILEDTKHFGENDPYHTDLQFLTEQKKGVGTKIRMKHFYRPIFWFNPDYVTCTITVCEPPNKYLSGCTPLPGHLVLREQNDTAWKTHVQEFILEPRDSSSTRVKFNVSYRVIPFAFFPLRFWARWLSQRRMAQKLREIEDACRNTYGGRWQIASSEPGVHRLT